MESNTYTSEEIARAHEIAIRIYGGEHVKSYDRSFMNDVCNEMGPESFYMDGEIFAQGH